MSAQGHQTEISTALRCCKTARKR